MKLHNGRVQLTFRKLEIVKLLARGKTSMNIANHFSLSKHTIEEINDFGTDANLPDTDDDGLTDFQEINTTGTDPTIPDTDDDGLNDGAEFNDTDTDPEDPDSDDDGLQDGAEVTLGTDPNIPDTDIDGCSDGAEVAKGTDPLNPDEGAPTLWYADTDGDGFGDASTSQNACLQPTGFVTDNTDCNDTSGAINPNTIWYADTDEDGFGNPNSTSASCSKPTGFVADNTDCDDTSANAFPNATQTITFAELSDIIVGDATITLSATASSGLPITYSLVGPATLNGATLTVTAAGTVTVTASQAGLSDCLAPSSLGRTFNALAANAVTGILDEIKSTLDLLHLTGQ